MKNTEIAKAKLETYCKRQNERIIFFEKYESNIFAKTISSYGTVYDWFFSSDLDIITKQALSSVTVLKAWEYKLDDFLGLSMK